jgi:phytoene desaturase
MEFPVLFLGAMPGDMPALYSLMNYAGLRLGTWYPMGGFTSVVNSLVEIGKRNGVTFHYNAPVEKILVTQNEVSGILINGSSFDCDGVIASADYQHVEQQLLPPPYRNYPADYWDRKTLAPSCLIYYLGINKKLDRLQHHTLFFDEDFDAHARSIYKDPAWPEKPQFYVSCPSRTDPGVAPEGMENLFWLMPIAPGLEDDETTREKYFRIMLNRFEKYIGEKIETNIITRRSYCVSDFITDYHSFRGNAYGLANTLSQTAWRKPKIRNHKLRNLMYAGQLTVPGPGVPPSLISGKIASEELNKHLLFIAHETTV